MIGHTCFDNDPWTLPENRFEIDLLPHTESLFALSNGHIGWRGILDEGEPHGLPGTYLNGVHELHPLPYAEAGYGYPESGQTVINVTNGKIIRLLVDDEPFDVRYGTLVSHKRVLDLRAGVLRRDVVWTSPTGRTVRIRSTRLISLTQRAIAAVRYEVEPLDGPARISLVSELVANEELPHRHNDPRAAAMLENPLVSDLHAVGKTRITLVHTVRHSGLRVAAAMDHTVELLSEHEGEWNDPEALDVRVDSEPDLGRCLVSGVVQPHQTVRLTKFVAHGWSASRSLPAMRDQVDAALAAAHYGGWDALCAEQADCLGEFWSRADVEIEGDAEIQQAVRFALFQLVQSARRAEQRAIPAKGLTGNGYDGHAFWDTESFVLQVLTYIDPQPVAHALRWRHSTLPDARERAAQLGLNGCAFPWRTITGQECSAYWPAGTAAFHVNADIADAVIRYLRVTGDVEFAHGEGMELLVETARLWHSLGHMDEAGDFRINGVTGPDEYSAIVDNNIYTNLMAQQNMLVAAEVVAHHPEHARKLGVAAEEAEAWREAADAMFIPYDELRDVHPQSDGFTDHEMWDFAGTPPEHYPLLLQYPYFQLYRKQVVKQADLVLALQMRSEMFTLDEKQRDFDYYEPLTVRDSSLSACSQAVIAAEVGCGRLAYDYLAEAALMDIDDLERNTSDGLHLASLAGSWIALVSGFGGMRHTDAGLSFSPQLPEGWTRLCFGLVLGDGRLRVDVRTDGVTYEYTGKGPLEVRHGDTLMQLEPGTSETQPLSPPKQRPAPPQPAGRQPARRAHDAVRVSV
ncbi:glycoside hydrolase family 65 protein [Actinospica sp. MGRD01-02]|uniref:Glycoside hydrolase family 65 protein n=1 Tax=Actinospica acidithermotolerans TaxID=2828514 RepID=A0A941E841_9ACTN|nr:glycoside hydrolase family 65 protein [Actinospica acidithermotolerans]MBR7826771.1 glycoside hydrolase family 65 protein [Actinospica acidithermotolerans]